jgi:hypothetical protein
LPTPSRPKLADLYRQQQYQPQWRRDTNASDCTTCVANAFKDAAGVPVHDGREDVTIYYDHCYLCFSYQNLLTSIDNSK